MTIRTMLTAALLLGLARAVCAQWPLDDHSPLETISTTFEMCDGPAWDGASSLFVPDVKGGKLYRYRPAQRRLSIELADAGRISAGYFNHGRLYLSDNGNSRIVRLGDGQQHVLASHDPEAKPPARPNDLVVDNQQGVYYTLTAQGRVNYVGPDGRQRTAVEQIETPNGIALSPDEQTLYVAAYAPKQIWAYDVGSPGKASNGRLFAAMDDGPDKGADGMTVDRAGNVYCAGAAHVWIWSPGGKLLARIETPSRPINCTFGDADMHSLYITGLGGLYRQRMHVTGRPPQPPSEASQQAAGEARPSTALPQRVAAHLDVVYARYGDRTLLADLFVPQDKPGPLPAVVVVHGGGWANGDKARFRALSLALAARGYVTAAVEYRLAGEARFPAAIHDVRAAVGFLRANAARYGIDAGRIGAVGGSAGGHLVGLMAAAPDDSRFQGQAAVRGQSPSLQAAVVMAGPMQLASGPVAERSRQAPQRSLTNVWLGKSIDEDPALYELASPYTHFSRATSPMLFMTGSLDNPGRDLPSIARLRELGVWTEQKVYADGKHGCWMQHPWFDLMVADIDAFFQAHLGC